MKTKPKDNLREGLVKAPSWIRQEKQKQPMRKPKPTMDEENAVEEEDKQTGASGN